MKYALYAQPLVRFHEYANFVRPDRIKRERGLRIIENWCSEMFPESNWEIVGVKTDMSKEPHYTPGHTIIDYTFYTDNESDILMLRLRWQGIMLEDIANEIEEGDEEDVI